MRANDIAAFPSPKIPTEVPGMTLRDYFAAHALAGLLGSDLDVSGWAPEHMAERVYRVADAMLAARVK
jgi:hypothetical protein